MKILFIHQNFPGQYLHLAPALAAQGHEVFALGDATLIQNTRRTPGVKRIGYPSPEPGSKATHRYLQNFETQIRRGQRVARALLKLQKKGFQPDVIHAHPGWGEALYLKDVYPDVPIIGLFEYYYRGQGHDLGFDPEFPDNLDARARMRTWNANHLIALEAADIGVSPTHYQKSVHPIEFDDKIRVIHEGIDTDIAKPSPHAEVTLTTNHGVTKFSREQKVVTFVARNLEPYRGYHSFARALPGILANKSAQVVIVGGDDKGYGRRAKEGTTWRQTFFDEVKDSLDISRVHFVPRIPYNKLITLLQVSSAHVYLTYPFVLSWSMLDAMSCGCSIVGSRTAPVEEFIEEGRNGLLVDIFDYEEIASTTLSLLEDTKRGADLGARARETILDRYSLEVCLPKQSQLIASLL